MKILVIGSGGREYAMARKFALEGNEVYVAPGNGGTKDFATNVPIAVDALEELVDFAKEKVDFCVVGPELPLTLGITDLMEEAGIPCFGPDQKSAMLEKSKAFTKHFLDRHGVATAKYEEATDYEEAVQKLEGFSYPVVIKADGLCAGKGVLICQDEEEALTALRQILSEGKFGEEGDRVVIEEYLDGFEASYFCIVSKGRLIPFGTAKDYKKIGEGDQGLNTGGVGCFSPNLLLDAQVEKTIREQVVPAIEKGLMEDDLRYSGVLFIGFMIQDGVPKVLEFNVRFGDPETEVLLERLETPLTSIVKEAVEGTLRGPIQFSDQVAMTLILTSKGYPVKYETGFEIQGLEDLEGVHAIHCGTKWSDGKLLTAGGRVLAVTGLADNLEDIRRKIYKEIQKISFKGMTFRKDIGII